MKLPATNEFADFGGRIWLNTAHQGALPRRAAIAAQEAIGWKTTPFKLSQERFNEVPSRLRGVFGRLVNAPPEEIVLANSASFGIHLVANALRWEEGDEVVVMANDFPSDILPWLMVEERYAVKVRRVRPAEFVPSVDEVGEHITARTKLVCLPWVHSFSGYATDLTAIGALCRAHGVLFLVNASQGLGAAPLDTQITPIDGLVCAGFKWLCGPYGTGLCWLNRELKSRLLRTKAYWLARQTAEDLGSKIGDVTLPDDLLARDFDVFGTANFFNFVPLASSIELLLEIGLHRIREHDQSLVSRLIANLPGEYRLISPRDGGQRSALVFLTHEDQNLNRNVYEALQKAGIHVAFRNGALRVSPHCYNTDAQIDHLLTVLDSFKDSN